MNPSWQSYKQTPSLKNISILVVDSDFTMVRLIGHFLRTMGFETIYHAKNGAFALDILRNRPVDLVITEWTLHSMDGIELVRNIRQDATIPNRTLPVIMLTGKNESSDVRKARDAGITEFLLKPFNAQTLYAHIEQVIERPRSFVLCDNYVGPERRRRMPPPDGEERRIIIPDQIHPRSLVDVQNSSTPIILSPSFALKERIGLTTSYLSSIITSMVLEKAQAVTETLSNESLEWLREDLATLEANYENLLARPNASRLEAFRESALTIKSRAGTFGYDFATDIASQLYLFLGEGYSPTSKYHQIIAHKHIEVLKTTFGTGIKRADALGIELMHELKRLIHI